MFMVLEKVLEIIKNFIEEKRPDVSVRIIMLIG